jgi:hypothetical protein
MESGRPQYQPVDDRVLPEYLAGISLLSSTAKSKIGNDQRPLYRIPQILERFYPGGKIKNPFYLFPSVNYPIGQIILKKFLFFAVIE